MKKLLKKILEKITTPFIAIKVANETAREIEETEKWEVQR
jgi:hypothetical protein